MFVHESLKDILKPKPSEEISNKIASMSVEEKQEVLFNTGMNHFIGDYEEFFYWLEKRYPEDDERLWDTIIATIYTLGLNPQDESGNDEEIDKEWVYQTFETDWLLQEVYLYSMKEKNIDDALSFLIPGYLSENVNDILKPKSQESIEQELNDLLKTNQLRDVLNKNIGGIFCLHIYEPDWTANIYFVDIDAIIMEFLINAEEAIKNDFYRRIIFYKLDPSKLNKNTEGRFSDEGSAVYGNGIVKVLAEISINERDDIKLRIY